MAVNITADTEKKKINVLWKQNRAREQGHFREEI